VGLVHGRRRIYGGGTTPSRNPRVPGRRFRAAKLQHTSPRTGRASRHDTRALAGLQSGGAAILATGRTRARGKRMWWTKGGEREALAPPMCFTEKSGRLRDLRIRSYSHVSTASACNGSADGGLCGTPPTCGGAGQAASAAKKSASVATTRGRPGRESRPSPVDTARHHRSSRVPSARKQETRLTDGALASAPVAAQVAQGHWWANGRREFQAGLSRAGDGLSELLLYFFFLISYPIKFVFQI
jgi:hypothetical protein